MPFFSYLLGLMLAIPLVRVGWYLIDRSKISSFWRWPYAVIVGIWYAVAVTIIRLNTGVSYFLNARLVSGSQNDALIWLILTLAFIAMLVTLFYVFLGAVIGRAVKNAKQAVLLAVTIAAILMTITSSYFNTLSKDKMSRSPLFQDATNEQMVARADHYSKAHKMLPIAIAAAVSETLLGVAIMAGWLQKISWENQKYALCLAGALGIVWILVVFQRYLETPTLVHPIIFTTMLLTRTSIFVLGLLWVLKDIGGISEKKVFQTTAFATSLLVLIQIATNFSSWVVTHI